MLSRKLNAYDLWMLNSNCNVQIAVRAEAPQHIPAFIEEIHNSMLGFRTRICGDRVEATRGCYEVLSLPKGLSTMRDMCVWTAQHRHPNTRALCTLAANDECVVLNASHFVADGHALTGLAHRLVRGERSDVVTGVPVPIMSVFGDEVRAAVTRCAPFDAAKMQRFPLRRVQCSEPIGAAHTVIPMHELAAYSRSDGRPHRISEAFWTAAILSGFALNNNFGRASIITVIDLRQFMKTAPTLRHLNMWSHVYECAEPNINDNIETMYKKLRSDFNRNIATGSQFAFLKHGILHQKTNFGVEVSSVGSIHIRPPVNDVLLNLYTDLNGGNKIVNDTFSVIGNGRNDMHITSAYSPDAISAVEIERYQKMFEYTLRNVSPKMRFREVLDELQKIK